MIFEKYIAGETRGDAYRALIEMMKGRDLGVSYADMIRFRLDGGAADECFDAYYVARDGKRGLSRHWNGWGKHDDAIGNWGNFFTEEACRDQGIGGRLLELWFEDFKSREENPICFLCSAGTKELTMLYRRFGFRPAMTDADRGPLYMPIGDSPADFREFCNDYYKPSRALTSKPATVGYRHEIDCLLRFALTDIGMPFGIGAMPQIENALLYCPERARILFAENGHAVGWSFDGEIQVHPIYKDSRIEG